MVSAAMGCGGDGISLSRQEAESTSIILTHLPFSSICVYAGGGCACAQGTHSLLEWVVLACTEDWPSEGDLPGHVGPWRSVEEVSKFLGSCD